MQEAEYEAALEQRRLEVEAEQTMLEIQQAQLMAGLLDPVTPTDAVPSLPESTTDAGQEEPSSVDYSRTPSETVQGGLSFLTTPRPIVSVNLSYGRLHHRNGSAYEHDL